MKSKFSSFRRLIAAQREANPKSWLSFLERWNLPRLSSSPVADVINAYKAHGKPFAADLNQMLVQQVACFTGKLENGEVISVVGEVLNWSADTLDTYNKIAGDLKGKEAEDVLEDESNKEANNTTNSNNSNNNNNEANSGLQTKTLLIIAGVVVVLFIGTILILKKKK